MDGLIKWFLDMFEKTVTQTANEAEEQKEYGSMDTDINYNITREKHGNHILIQARAEIKDKEGNTIDHIDLTKTIEIKGED